MKYKVVTVCTDYSDNIIYNTEDGGRCSTLESATENVSKQAKEQIGESYLQNNFGNIYYYQNTGIVKLGEFDMALVLLEGTEFYDTVDDYFDWDDNAHEIWSEYVEKILATL